MYLPFLYSALLAGAALVASHPLDQNNNQDLGISVSRCERLINCEVYTTAAGTKGTRFAKGYEPDSPAMREILANATGLHKRQDNGVVTTIDISPVIRGYGTADPLAIAESLFDNCLSNSCDNEFGFESSFDTGGRLNLTPRNLVVTTSGFFVSAGGSGIRDALIETMVDVVGANIDRQTRPRTNPQAFGGWSPNFSPAAFSVVTETTGETEALAGTLVLRVELDEASVGVCNILAGAILGNLPGTLPSILGTLAPILCEFT